MKVGCGVRIRTIGNNQYLIFWYYVREAGRSVKREKYLGRADDSRARTDGLSYLREYLLECRDEIDQRISSAESDLNAVAGVAG